MKNWISIMRKLLPVALLILLFVSCTSRTSVNIIVTNTQPHTIYNVEIVVSLSEVCRLMETDSIFSPIVLNEKNVSVPYTYSIHRDSIRFFMPIIHNESQKTFSINSQRPSLSNTFLRNRNNIQICR